jgi:hypothetical protein
MCKHSIQFNPSSFLRPSPTCEHIHTDAQDMELTWMDTYVWEKLWLHSATQWCTGVNIEGTNMSVQNNTVLSLWRQLWNRASMAVTTTVSMTTEAKQQNSVFTMKAKLWNRGENNSVHNDAALSLWRQNSMTMVTTALKTAVFTTTWHSHFEDKIMKHQWQQEVLLTSIMKLWNTSENNIVFQQSYLKRSNHELLVAATMLICKDVIMKHQWPQWLWACNYEIMVTTINLKLQLWEFFWQVWTAITHFEDEIWWNIDSHD